MPLRKLRHQRKRNYRRIYCSHIAELGFIFESSQSQLNILFKFPILINKLHSSWIIILKNCHISWPTTCVMFSCKPVTWCPRGTEAPLPLSAALSQMKQKTESGGREGVWADGQQTARGCPWAELWPCNSIILGNSIWEQGTRCWRKADHSYHFSWAVFMPNLAIGQMQLFAPQSIPRMRFLQLLLGWATISGLTSGLVFRSICHIQQPEKLNAIHKGSWFPAGDGAQPGWNWEAGSSV